MAHTAFEGVAVEQVQEYWNRRPCNIRHSTKPVGSREYFDEVDVRRYLVEYHIPGFAEFERWRDMRVLEVGCGIGTDTTRFARAGARVTAVDLSEKSLEVARQRMGVYGLSDRVQFFSANAEELTSVVPQETYDLIYSFGVIHHTPHPDRVLAEMRKYAGPNTTLKLMVYHRYAWKVLWILLGYGHGQFWKLSQLVARNSEAQTGCPVTFTYSRRGAEALLERSGFRATEIRVEHVFPYRVEDYVQYRYVKEWYFRWMPAPMFRAFERRFGWHLCITARPSERVD